MGNNNDTSAAGLAARTLIIFGLYCLVDYLRIHPYLNWFMLFFVGLGVLSILNALVRDWWRGRLLKKAATPTGLYGSTEAIGLRHLLDAGLTTDGADGNGIPLGAFDNKILLYCGSSHLSLRAATGAGKTESSFVPVCMSLDKDRNIIATGKGKEPAEFIADYRISLGQLLIIVDIGNQMKGTRFKTHDFNPCGHLVEFADKNDPALIEYARKIANARLTIPKNAGDNQFFTKQARKWLKDIMAACAIWQAETGELVCNLPYIFSKLNSDDEDLKAFLLQLSTLDHFDGAISGGIKRILSKWNSSPKTFDSVLSEIENGLEIFDPVGHIGQTSQHSDFDPRDIKRKPMTILLITDPTKSDTQGSIAGLYLDIINNFALEADSFEPRVTVLADEFANLSDGKLPSILPTLYTGRSKGVQLVTYAQDTSTFKDRYGDEASAFTTQCEIVLISKCSSTTDAEEYSKRSGQISVMTENLNMPDDAGRNSAKSYSFGISEKGIARHRPDEFLHMPDYTGALFFKQLPAVMIELVSYQQVSPWNILAGKPSNIGDQAKLEVKYHL